MNTNNQTTATRKYCRCLSPKQTTNRKVCQKCHMVIANPELPAWSFVIAIIGILAFCIVVSAMASHFGMTWPELHPEVLGY